MKKCNKNLGKNGVMISEKIKSVTYDSRGCIYVSYEV